MKIDRTGETRIMNCGLNATIIRYNKSNDIDVKFEDGYIAYNKSYNHFKNGKIRSRLKEQSRLGEELVMNNGMKAKIIKYNGSEDIDVLFEDGYISTKQCYNHFKNRRLASRLEFTTRVGRKSTMKSGEIAEIIRYDSAKDISVKFSNGYILEHVNYEQFKAGTLYSIHHPTVEGVGYLGNSNPKDDNGITKKSYATWRNMLRRAYNSDFKAKYPTYLNVTVDSSWHSYENFEKWYNENYYEIGDEIMNLDKDILFKGNKIYSSETCVFAPCRINNLFVKCDALRGNLPMGVRKNGKRYYVSWYQNNKKIETPTMFDTPEEAFNAYKKFKENYIKQVADEYKPYIPKELYDAMYRWEVDIDD